MPQGLENAAIAASLTGRKMPVLSRRFAALLATGILCLVVWGDYVTSWYFLFDFFYLLPLSVVTIYVGRRAGMIMALACTLCWISPTVVQRHPALEMPLTPGPVILIWSFLMRLAVQAGFVWVLARLRQELLEQQRLLAELQKALADVKQLRELLPICAWSHKIRDDAGYWKQLDQYLYDKDIATFTHGIRPECEAEIGVE